MSSSAEKIDEIKTKYKELCRELNMDKETEIVSWNNYQYISQNFMLEGDQNHWVCCSLYAACRESFTPTVGSSTSVVKGNCVSLTKLLRSCNVSIYEFFTKIKNWIEMANLSKQFFNHIDRLERSFSTTYHIYKHYQSIFEKLFVISPNEKKHKKARPGRCSATKLYDMCWCLYLCAKNEDPKNTTVDVATAYHFLLCCMDLIFNNAVSDNRVDLINTSFAGVPKNWNTPEYKADSTSAGCIIDSLCQLADAPYNLVKSMKMTLWKPVMEKLIESKTISGHSQSLLKIISNENFEPNLKSLNNTYEHYSLSVGEFDERIFLTNASFRKSNNNDFEKDKQSHMNASVRSLVPSTPLTRKHNLPSKDDSEPVACATKNVKKLQDVAEKYTQIPEFIRQVTDTMEQKLEDRLTIAEEKFCDKFPTKLDAQKRFKLARSLYYYFLEKIIQVEVRTKPNLDLKLLLDSDVFCNTVIACCLEIILAAYNSYNSDDLNFPWILDCLNLSAFHFYKIIEIVITRSDGILSRDIIKHLNGVEETCLESLVWRNNSPLWDAIKQAEKPLPSWDNVELKKYTDSDHLSRSIIQSPMNSAYDCFNQPTTSNENARRDLFNAGKSAEANDRQTIEACRNNNTDGRKKAGSLSLFFRKFYKLAWIRIRKLCQDIEMDNEAYLNKIWTLFEYSISLKTELMHDRHLDQILMCAIYVFIKVAEIKGKTFADIMINYRNQPQAASNIYREALIEPAKKDGDDITPAKYGDIINFYNAVYVQKMTPYALNFSDKEKSKHDLLLSPHPPARPQYPKKVSNSHQLFIQPLEKKDLPQSPNNLTFEFARSPAKALDKINEIVRNGKRNLPFNEDVPTVIHTKMAKPSQGSHFQRKIHGIVIDRQGEHLKK